jgi:hypothetical protein
MVLCDPGYETAEANFLKRKGQEYLKTTAQLKQVHQTYRDQPCQLPVVTYDYTDGSVEYTLIPDIERYRHDQHPLYLASAGSWDAPTVLVGEGFAERKDQDPWYQWPFGSFSGEGCSRWLTDQLDAAMVPEGELLWINADQNLEFLHARPGQVIALGAKAAAELYRLKIRAVEVPHPQHHKRFNSHLRYQLFDFIGAHR